MARLDPAKYSDQYSTVDTMFHEAAHTVQKETAKYDKMKGIPFTEYNGKETAPPEEILATLRAHEAKQKAGTTIWQTEMGKDVLAALMAKNPSMSKQGVQRYVDNLMFPEHSSLHPSEDSNPTDKPDGFWRASASLLKRLKP